VSYNPLIISSSNKTYSVAFVSQFDELLTELITIKNPLVVIDRKILEMYPEFGNTFSKLYSIDATEQNKSLAGVEQILEFFQSADATRSSTVIGIGGGTLGDTVSFAAHIFYRGLNLVLVPTTLLSMCDSCIGGKCGVNFNGYKNQIGAFHPPEKVIIWPGFLKSLSAADLRSGYGEILKYKLLSGYEDYTQFKLKLMQQGMNYLDVLPDIYHGLCIKKKLIEEDEFDVGVRHLLNYGHTFGHALERATENTIPHGVAVARGIDIANYIAWQRGLLSRELFEDVHLFVENYFGWEFDRTVTDEELVANIKRDKKMVAGSHEQVARLKMVLMEDVGKFKIESILLDELFVVTMPIS
jgi:3-dehydroquinate synthase